MGLCISPLNSNYISVSPMSSNAAKNTLFTGKNKDQNPISSKGETLNLIKATFLGGLALGARLLWEIFDGDFLFETAGKKASSIVNKTRQGASQNKKTFLWLGATTAIIAAAISGFAIIYTMLNAPKIAYNSKINTFKKKKEMDVYIKSNEAEKEIYNQLSEKAKSADQNEKDKLKEQYMQMKMAKNRVPDFVKL